MTEQYFYVCGNTVETAAKEAQTPRAGTVIATVAHFLCAFDKVILS